MKSTNEVYSVNFGIKGLDHHLGSIKPGEITFISSLFDMPYNLLFHLIFSNPGNRPFYLYFNHPYSSYFKFLDDFYEYIEGSEYSNFNVDFYNNKNIIVDDTTGISIDTIHQHLHKARSENKLPKVIIIEELQRLFVKSRRHHDISEVIKEVAIVSRNLRYLVNHFHLPVIICSCDRFIFDYLLSLLHLHEGVVPPFFYEPLLIRDFDNVIVYDESFLEEFFDEPGTHNKSFHLFKKNLKYIGT